MTHMTPIEHALDMQAMFGPRARCTWLQVGEYISLLEEVIKLRSQNAEAEELLLTVKANSAWTDRRNKWLEDVK